MMGALRLALSLCAILLVSCSTPDSGCLVNGDCASNEQCVSGTCVAKIVEEVPVENVCEERDACEGATDCDTGVCENGCCAVTCEDDTTCRDDEWCRGGWCRPIGSPCVSNNDCSGNRSTPACDVNTGMCVGCLTGADCGIGEVCENRGCHAPPSTGCALNTDCTVDGLGYCFVPAAICVSCLEDSDCKPVGTAVCDVRNHACRPLTQGCGWDGDCVGNIGGKRCRDDRTCVQCLKNEDCPRNRVCQSDNTCTTWPSCSADSDCQGTTPHCRPSDSRCVECTTTSQCGSGKTCRDGLCLPSVNGCGDSSHCTGAQKVCDTRNRTCVTCRNMDDCDGGFCRNDTCTPCEANSVDCLLESPHRPHCISGGCRQCINDTSCDDGWVCENMACMLDPVDMPCPQNGRCIRDQRCVPDERGVYTCRNSCDPLGATNECPAGKACALAYFQAGLAVGTCLPKTPGAAQLNQSCSEQTPCEVNLECLPSGPNASKCRRRCDPESSSPSCQYPDVCQNTVERDQRGVPQIIGLCFPDSRFGKPCSADNECNSGQICSAGPNPAQPFEWGNFCKWPKGDKTGGQSCSQDNECRSGLCLAGGPKSGGFCQGACQSDADCPESNGVAGACGQAAVPWTDPYGNPTSVDVASCVLTCRDDTECAASQFCEVLPNAAGTAWTSRCRPSAQPTAAKGGATCRAGSECRSGTCITFGNESPAGICAGACDPAKPSACNVGSECPPNGVLRPIGSPPELHPAPICWTKTCTNDTQCGNGRVCAPYPDPLNPARTLLNCLPSQGTVVGGGACTLSNECRSNLCLSSGSGGRCFGACETDTDCKAGGTCKNILWKQTDQIVRACRP